MERRRLMRCAGSVLASPLLASHRRAGADTAPFRRRRPGDPDWPSAARWEELNRRVGGRPIAVRSPFAACRDAADSQACRELLGRSRNPFFPGEEAALTQASGWADAWTSAPSACAVAARNAGGVAAAADFARENRSRLVVKGGGHSYAGALDAPA